LHDPPGEDNALKVHPNAPEAIKLAEQHLAHAVPETNPWACIIMLIIAVGVMAYTAEMVSHAYAYFCEMPADLVRTRSWSRVLNLCGCKARSKKSKSGPMFSLPSIT